MWVDTLCCAEHDDGQSWLEAKAVGRIVGRARIVEDLGRNHECALVVVVIVDFD
jgi:hypothetical protein